MSTNPNFPEPDANSEPEDEVEDFDPERFERVKITARFRRLISTTKLPETPEEYLAKDTLPPGEMRGSAGADGGSSEPTEGRGGAQGTASDSGEFSPVVPKKSGVLLVACLLGLGAAGLIVWLTLSGGSSDAEPVSEVEVVPSTETKIEGSKDSAASGPVEPKEVEEAPKKDSPQAKPPKSSSPSDDSQVLPQPRAAPQQVASPQVAPVSRPKATTSDGTAKTASPSKPTSEPEPTTKKPPSRFDLK